MPSNAPRYRPDAIWLRLLLTFWLAPVAFFAFFTADQFEWHPIAVAFIAVVVINGLCFVPPLLAPLFVLSDLVNAVAQGSANRPRFDADDDSDGSLDDMEQYDWDSRRRRRDEDDQRAQESADLWRQADETRQQMDDWARHSREDFETTYNSHQDDH